jgi:hypothetical protein
MKEYKLKFAGNQKYIGRIRNRYCSGAFNKKSMINICRGGWGKRYSAVNLSSLAEKQNTIEFRIFPYQSDSDEAKATVDWLIKTITKITEAKINLGKAGIEYYDRIGELSDYSIEIKETPKMQEREIQILKPRQIHELEIKINPIQEFKKEFTIEIIKGGKICVD